jgi:hypothetical protein
MATARKLPFRKAGWFWRPVLIKLGAAGITMPWGAVYLLAPWFRVGWIRRHELVHLRQIERDGAAMFTLRYLYFTIRFGYWKNPYEVEAYAKASPPNPR